MKCISWQTVKLPRDGPANPIPSNSYLAMLFPRNFSTCKRQQKQDSKIFNVLVGFYLFCLNQTVPHCYLKRFADEKVEGCAHRLGLKTKRLEHATEALECSDELNETGHQLNESWNAERGEKSTRKIHFFRSLCFPYPPPPLMFPRVHSSDVLLRLQASTSTSFSSSTF